MSFKTVALMDSYCSANRMKEALNVAIGAHRTLYSCLKVNVYDGFIAR